MPDVIKRLKYFNGQFLREPDFTDEQDYHLDRQRRHNRQLHTPGIADGLAVTANQNETSVSVAPGTAVDGLGRQIVLNETRDIGFPTSLNGQTALVVIFYDQEESDPATVGEQQPTRWKEVARVEAIPDPGTSLDSERIALARLQISTGGTITQSDLSVRTPVGARLHPEATIERLRLSRQGVPDSQWPVLSSGAANRADLAGSLSVTGSISVTGTVDGRDVSADAALNDTHRGRTDNPHSVTAAQVGAIASVAGVSNPGGNIAINGVGGISVNGDDAANSISITGVSPATIDGVSNPGGNIDFVGSGGISISPDNGSSKRITFSTSASAIGALPAGDYLRRYITWGDFQPSETTKTIPAGFLPKVIFVSWSLYGDFSGRSASVDSTALAVVQGVSNWSASGCWHYRARLGGAPYWSSMSVGAVAPLLWLDFNNHAVSPSRRTELKINLDSVNNSGFVLRQIWTVYNVPLDLRFQLVALG